MIMFMGACRITLALPGNRSLKGKRQVVRRVCDKLKHKFHAAAAEVGDPEQWSEAEVGFVVVSGNQAHARAMAENIVSFVAGMLIAPLQEVELEVIPFDDVATGGTYGDVETWGSLGRAKLGGMAEGEES